MSCELKTHDTRPTQIAERSGVDCTGAANSGSRKAGFRRLRNAKNRLKPSWNAYFYLRHLGIGMGLWLYRNVVMI